MTIMWPVIPYFMRNCYTEYTCDLHVPLSVHLLHLLVDSSMHLYPHAIARRSAQYGTKASSFKTILNPWYGTEPVSNRFSNGWGGWMQQAYCQEYSEELKAIRKRPRATKSDWPETKHNTTNARSVVRPSVGKAWSLPRWNGRLSTGWIPDANNHFQHQKGSRLQRMVQKNSSTEGQGAKYRFTWILSTQVIRFPILSPCLRWWIWVW